MSAVDVGEVEKRHSVRASFAWALIGQGLYFALQFGSSVTLARLLSPYELGIFSIALATMGMITAIQSFGLNNFIVRSKTIDRDMLSAVFTINLGISGVLGLAIFLLGVLGQAIFKDPGVKWVLMWLAWNPFINGLALIPTSRLQREGNFRAISLLRIASTGTGTVCTVAMAFAGFSYMSLAYGQTVAAVMSTVATCLIAPRFIHFRLGMRSWRSVMHFGTRMVVINGMVQLQRQVSNFSLGNLRGLASLGLYSRANNLYNLLSDQIHTVLVRVILTDFAAVARSGVPLRGRYMKVLEFMTAFLWPAFAGMAVLSAPIVHILYGPRWGALAIPLSLLCLNGILWVSVTMTWELFVVSNETDKQARFEFIRSGVGVGLFVLGALYSLPAACFGRVLEGLFTVYLYRPHIRRMTQSRPGDFDPIFRRSAALSALAVAPAFALMLHERWNPATSVGLVVASVVVGGLFWAGGLVAMRHPVLDEVKRLRKRRGARAVEASAG